MQCKLAGGTATVRNQGPNTGANSCGHISRPHEPISTKFGMWRFFLITIYGIQNAEMQKKVFVMLSLQYYKDAPFDIQREGMEVFKKSLPPPTLRSSALNDI